MRTIFCIILILLGNSIYSQDTLTNIKYKSLYFQAEELVIDLNYIEAISLYEKMMIGREDNSNLHFKLGYCYLNDKFDKSKSLKYLEKAAHEISEEYDYDDFKETKAPIDTYFYLGNALQFNYNFEQAIFYYGKFKDLLKDDNSDLIKKVDKRIEECSTGLTLIEYPVDMTIENLGGNINSKYDEHSPVITADESVLLYTSKRKGKDSNEEHTDGQYFENVYESKSLTSNWEQVNTENNNAKWEQGSSVFNAGNHNQATISLSVDGQMMYIYMDEENNGNIYESKLENNRWTQPKLLSDNINTKYKESHASISPNQNILYFTSDKPGGFGGSDIYMSKKLPNGKWAKAQNLGSQINTEYDEESPYIHADGMTLFYSSRGKGSMGGYDIFFSMLEEDGKWTEATNIGYPINTTGEDVFYVPTPDGKRAYYSSFNKDGFGGSDIYLISLSSAKAKPLTVYSGQILMCNGKPPENIFITVTDMDSDKEIGMYTPNAVTGKFLFILKSGKKYKIDAEAENDFSYSEIIDVTNDKSYNKIKKAIVLKPVVFTGEKEDFTAVFSANSNKINDKILAKIDSIGVFIKKYPKFYVGISDASNENNKKYIDRKQILINKIKQKNPVAKVHDVSNIPPCSNVVNFIVKESSIEQPNEYFVSFNSNSKEITASTHDNINKLSDYLHENSDCYVIIINETGVIGDLYEQRKQALVNNILKKEPNAQIKDLNDITKGAKIVRIIIKDNDEVVNNKNNSLPQGVVPVGGELVLNNILFPFDKYETNEYNRNLDVVASYLSKNKNIKIKLIGYTDAQGSVEYNLVLSKNRVIFVKKYLKNKGVLENQIEIDYKGLANQVAKDISPESRKFNRRVEFAIIKKGGTKIKVKKEIIPNQYKL